MTENVTIYIYFQSTAEANGTVLYDGAPTVTMSDDQDQEAAALEMSQRLGALGHISTDRKKRWSKLKAQFKNKFKKRKGSLSQLDSAIGK